MTEAEHIADRIRQTLPRLKSGTLRFWGEWFGKPYDNYHTVVGCSTQGDCLHIQFDGGELLSIWSPRRAIITEKTFRIEEADRVRWEWFFYGRPKDASNRYFEDFERTGNQITASTNIDWYKPDFRPDASQPAVEIL